VVGEHLQILDATGPSVGHRRSRFLEASTRASGLTTSLAGVKKSFAGVKKSSSGVKKSFAGLRKSLAGGKKSFAGVKKSLAGVAQRDISRPKAKSSNSTELRFKTWHEPSASPVGTEPRSGCSTRHEPSASHMRTVPRSGSSTWHGDDRAPSTGTRQPPTAN